MTAVAQEWIENEVAILQNVEAIVALIVAAIDKNDTQRALHDLKNLTVIMQARRKFWDMILQEQP